jgi:hypothetical protein
MNKYKYGFDHTTSDGQKRLMAISAGLDSEAYIRKPIVHKLGDTGADPIGDGTFKMYPSGDVVSYNERCRRLTSEKK